MKKIILVMFSFFLFGCARPYDYKYIWDSPKHFGTLESISSWVCFKIKYDIEKVKNNIGYWQTPEETYNKGTGICTDKSILFMYWAYDAGFDCQLVIFIGYDKEQPENLGRWSHAVVKCIDKYWDPTYNKVYNKIEDFPKKGFDKITKIYSYSDTMYLAEKFHGD